MIRILTDSGKWLDLAPDATFDIEIENSFFTEGIPVPWSTSIAFPLSERNRRIFGFWDAFKMEPENKEIAATIYIGGLPMISGTLTYDSFEDNCLNYCFSGRNLEEDLSVKLFNLSMPAPGLKGMSSALDVKNRLRAGYVDGVYAPPCINRSFTAYAATRSEINVKFHNYPSSSYGTVVTPVISARRILSAGAPSLDFALPDEVAVVGLYKGEDNYPFCLADNVATVLPDVTLINFIKSLAMMFKGAIFKDGHGFRMIRFSTILSDTDILELDGLVADDLSMSREPGKAYNLSFKEETASGNTLEEDDGSSSEIRYAGTIDAALNEMASSSSYIGVRHGVLTDVYSGKKGPNTVATDQKDVLDDIIYSAGKDTQDEDEDDKEVCEVGFTLVQVVPFRYAEMSGDPPRPSGDYHNAMMPLLTPLKLGEERKEDVIIGVMAGGYLTDKGRIDVENISGYAHSDAQRANSITPSSLRARYHSDYASWLSKDRQVLTVELNLSEEHIAAFKIWKQVHFAGRQWLVRKITFSFTAGVDGALTSAELISL